MAQRLARGLRQLSMSTKLAATEAEQPVASTSKAVNEWKPASKRVGVIAIKRGMTALHDKSGNRIPCTVLQMQDVQIVSHRSTPYTAVEVGCVDRPIKKTSAAMLGHFKKAGIAPKHRTMEFRIDENDPLVQVGATLQPAHFVPGQFLDVRARTIGKGFQGVMKRHGFKGLRASHGVSISHRSPGSTGQHQDPGRVFPGKKMPGHMGDVMHTVQNLLLLRIDNTNKLLYVKGAVPGSPGAYVRVSDALKRRVGGKKGGVDKFGVETLPWPAATSELVQEWHLPEEVALEDMSTKGRA